MFWCQVCIGQMTYRCYHPHIIPLLSSGSSSHIKCPTFHRVCVRWKIGGVWVQTYNRVAKLVNQSWRGEKPASDEVIAFIIIQPLLEKYMLHKADKYGLQKLKICSTNQLGKFVFKSWRSAKPENDEIIVCALFNLQFEQIHLVMWTNTSCSLYKCIL